MKHNKKILWSLKIYKKRNKRALKVKKIYSEENDLNELSLIWIFLYSSDYNHLKYGLIKEVVVFNFFHFWKNLVMLNYFWQSLRILLE